MNIHFLAYSSRSGSTFLATQLSRRFRLLVLPETQCLYALLSSSPTRRLGDEAVESILRADKQAYWIDEAAIASIIETGWSVPSAVEGVIRAYGESIGIHDSDLPVLIKLGGALHIWRSIGRWYPDVGAIAILRDGRAVANSALSTAAPYLPGASLAFGDPVRAAKVWKHDVRVAVAEARRHGTRIHLTKYEDLLQDADHELARLGLLAGWSPIASEGQAVPFEVGPSEKGIHPLVQSGPSLDRAQGWREELAHNDRVVIEAICGAELRALGYQDHLDVQGTSRMRALGVAWFSHLLNETRMSARRVRRIRSLSELGRKVRHRFARLRSGMSRRRTS